MTEDVTSTQDSKLNDSSRRLEQRNLVLKRTECPREREGPRATPRGERVSHVYVLPASTLHFRDRLQFFTPQASGMVYKDITQRVMCI